MASEKDVEDPALIYQTHFMEDSVPTTDGKEIYSAGSNGAKFLHQDDHKEKDDVCYANQPSIKSEAKSDGEAFYSDPSWTLLTKMKIMPILSTILRSNTSAQPVSSFTFSFTSICGILTMLAMRSHGSASAIANHVDILSSLLRFSLTLGEEGGGSEQNGFVLDPKRAKPVLTLLVVLARQSREIVISVASLNSIIPTLQGILVMNAENDSEYTVQRLSLILWRIFIRYGFGLGHISTFLSLSASHLGIAVPTKYSLAVEYLVTFASVCECAEAMISSTPPKKSNLNLEEREALIASGLWLAPHARASASFLNSSQRGTPSSTNLFSTNQIKLAAARTRLLASFSTAALNVNQQQESTLRPLIPLVSVEDCIGAVRGMLNSGMVLYALRLVLTNGESSDTTNNQEQKISALETEASASALLKSFFLLLTSCNSTVSALQLNNDDNNKKLSSIIKQVHDLVMEELMKFLRTSSSSSFSIDHDHAARIRWINVSQFYICKFMSSTPLASSRQEHISVLRSFTFSLIGQLQRGEEAIAALLTSHDIIFELRSTNQVENDNNKPLQSMLLRELSKSRRSVQQLNHSFRLLSLGRGIIPTNTKSVGGGPAGPFALESLRSDATYVIIQTEEADDNNDDQEQPLLPLGNAWLWHVLSGRVKPTFLNNRPDQINVNRLTRLDHIRNVADVVLSCMQLLVEMETENEVFTSGSGYYARKIDIGTKLYHLFNSCLFPEDVVRDARFNPLFTKLFEMYAYPLSKQITNDDRLSRTKNKESHQEMLIRCFVTACFEHSRSSRTKKKVKTGPAIRTKKEKAEEKLSAFFQGTDENNTTSRFSSLEMNALMEFINDLCDAYVEYGAQYDAFARCTRFFLWPKFPPNISCEILSRLRGLLHLLTTAEELNDQLAMQRSLEVGFADSILFCPTSSQGDIRYPAVTLDAYASIFADASGSLSARLHDPESEGNYFYLWVVASFAWNLAVLVTPNAQEEEKGMEVLKRRFKRLPLEMSNDIVSVVARLLIFGESKFGCSSKNLAETVVSVCVRREFKSVDLNDRNKYQCVDEIQEKIIQSLQSIER